MRARLVWTGLWGGVLLSFLLGACGPGQIYDYYKQTKAVDCLPNDANAGVFEQAVCLCGDLDKVGSGLTTSSFSSFGPQDDTLGKAHVGINGDARSIGSLKVDGDLDVAGLMEMIAGVIIKRNLFVGGDLVHRGHWSVGYDAYVGGNLYGWGGMQLGGSLQVEGDILILGRLDCDQVATGVPFLQHTPCPCDPQQLVDVAAEVAEASGAQPVDPLSGQGRHELVLTGGDYYAADGMVLGGSTRITVEASSRLFVDGDVEIVGSGFVEVADDTELDIYIAGSVAKIGNLQVGWPKNPSAARAIRVYIGGSNAIAMEVTGNTRFEGAVYAPAADILYTGNLIVEGSLFARNLVGNGHVLVRYDAGIVGGGCLDSDCDPAVDDSCVP